MNKENTKEIAYKYSVLCQYELQDEKIIETAIWIPSKALSVILRTGNILWGYSERDASLSRHEKYKKRTKRFPWEIFTDIKDELTSTGKCNTYIERPQKLEIDSSFAKLAEETMEKFFEYEKSKDTLIYTLETNFPEPEIKN